MTEVQSQIQTNLNDPPTQEVTEKEPRSPEKGSLTAQLDALLEKYLKTLDAYQKAQHQLTTLLSSGFLSLAQANFNNQSGARYGQDYYDERMQASRKITVTVEETNIGFLVSAPDLEVPGTVEADGRDESSEKVPIVSATTTATDPPDANDASSRASKARTAPLHWFGILVPQALRTAEATFTTAVEGPIPQLAWVVKDLRQQEIDIARLRKQLKKLEPKS